MTGQDASPAQWQRLASGFQLSVPADEKLIMSVEMDLGIQLPAEYRQFLRRSNGAEGGIGESGYLMVWPVEELKRLNADYEVAEYAPGYLVFGSDGSGEAFAFDLATPSLAIVSLPFVGMSRELAKPVGVDFWDFLETLYNL